MKGLRQGDPLSPILFNIVVDMLAILINRAKDEGQVSGVVPHLVDGGLSILQYADDTILFMDHDIEKATNMKMLLCAFEQLSGLKIEFHRVKYFVLDKIKSWNNSTQNYLVVNLGSILLDIFAFQCIESLAMQIGGL